MTDGPTSDMRFAATVRGEETRCGAAVSDPAGRVVLHKININSISKLSLGARKWLRTIRFIKNIWL